MDDLPVSVVVVSLGRPEALRRCLTAVVQLDYGPFEVVVVSDADSLAAVAGLPFAAAIKLQEFSEPNISRARNLGAVRAGGEILAFIDDDAVPEPTWLRSLAEAFEGGADAAVGFVRGRNGISFQSRAEAISREAVTVPAAAPSSAAVPVCPDGFVPKLIGTNMAIRRDTLRQLGGFDESFRFYLEDSDLSLRLAAAGSAVAAVPAAEVHHGFAASARRTEHRVPRDLTDIGRSLALFLRKHADAQDAVPARDRARNEERRRLLRHMVTGALETRDVAPLLAMFDTGFAEGLTARSEGVADIGSPPPFEPVADAFRSQGHTVLVGRLRDRARLRARAAQEVRAGRRATLFIFGPTTVYHQVRFTSGGYWEQTGGIFGRSERQQPIFRAVSFATRARQEVRRVAKARGIDETC